MAPVEKRFYFKGLVCESINNFKYNKWRNRKVVKLKGVASKLELAFETHNMTISQNKFCDFSRLSLRYPDSV